MSKIKTIFILLNFYFLSRETFKNVGIWLNEAKDNSEEGIKLFLVGNKKDLDKCREVSFEEGEQFKIDNEFDGFKEVSAKNEQVGEELFTEVATILYNNFFEAPSVNSGVKIKVAKPRKEIDASKINSCGC